MSAPLVVNTRDGGCWTRRTVTESGIALYAPEAVRTCPEFVMATLAELAEHGIVGSADVLPVPVGPQMPDFPPPPATELEKLRSDRARLQCLLADATREAHLARRERDLIRERVSEPYGCQHCGVARRGHGRRSISGAGTHSWERPTDEQVKARMLARRAARMALDVAHEAGRRDRYAKALYEFVNGAFVWEACDDQWSWLAEADAAIVVADAEQAELRTRVAELEAQRERRRARLVALQNDALNMRGALSPNGEARKVPFPLGDDTLTPAVEWLINRVAELETAQGTVYRASHDSIVMGLYATREAAMHHCEAHELRDDPVSPMSWDVDEDGVAELVRIRVPRSPGAEQPTGYVVTPLEVASEYDEEADE